MKNVQRSFILLMIFSLSLSTAYAQNWSSKIKGEGQSITKELSLETFNEIGLSISADVVLTQGNSQSIKIKAQSNIIDNISTKVRNGSWQIKFKEKVYKHQDITIYITIKGLEALSIGGSGSIIGTNKFQNLDELDLAIGGSGDIELEFEANELNCAIAGSGSMELEGRSDKADISISGSGDIEAIDLETNDCEISNVGSGDVNISVEKSLQVSLLGSGDISYKGSPKVETRIMGSGSVEQH